jgi:arylsulfatase
MFKKAYAKTALFVAVSLIAFVMTSTAQQKTTQLQENLISSFIMGDDIGWLNIGCYNQGLMATKTPNLDRLQLRNEIYRLLC